MCVQEKQLGQEERYYKKSLSDVGVKDTTVDITDTAKIQRSKSDAQTKSPRDNVAEIANSNNESNSNFVKRSRSFQRIFRYSMLSRSKEYRL